MVSHVRKGSPVPYNYLKEIHVAREYVSRTIRWSGIGEDGLITSLLGGNSKGVRIADHFLFQKTVFGDSPSEINFANLIIRKRGKQKARHWTSGMKPYPIME